MFIKDGFLKIILEKTFGTIIPISQLLDHEHFDLRNCLGLGGPRKVTYKRMLTHENNLMDIIS